MIKMSDIIDEFNPNIRKKSQPVTFPMSNEDKKVLADLLAYVHNSVDEEIAEKYGLRPSVGIAAPQIDVLKQLCVVSSFDENGDFFEYQFINPKIIRHSNHLSYLPTGEGCLSVNRLVEGLVPRYESVTIRNHQPDGTPYEIKLSGYAAIVAQHELDHLNGILFMDKINQEHPLLPPPNSSPLIFADEQDED